MELRGTVQFAATCPQVWQLLTSPHQVSQCTPGLIDWQEIEPARLFRLNLAWSGPQTPMRLPIKVEWLTLEPPHRLVWQAQTRLGNLPLFCRGEFLLSPLSPKQAELRFTAVLTPPNKFLEQLIRNQAPRLIDTFFQCLRAQVTAA